MARAYSYVRFSTPTQAAGDSLRRQTKNSKRWCEENGHTLDDTLGLHDKGVSAWKGDNLTTGKLGAFLTEVKGGRVPKGSYLIVESLDRLSRQGVRKALRVFLDILDLGINIVTLSPLYVFQEDGLDEMQLIVAIVILGRAHDESDIKSYRGLESWDNKRQKATTEKLTAKCPLWMRLSKDRTKFDPIPERVEAVKMLFTLTTLGLGSVRLVKHMNANVKPMGKKPWSKSSIRRILGDRAVLGEYQPHTGSHKRRDRKPVGDPIKDYYPRVIEDDLFYAAQSAIKKNSVQRGRKGNKVTNLFTGLVKDSTGASMTVVMKDDLRLVSYEATRGRGQFISFPYEPFEVGILRWLKELRAEDVVTANMNVADQLAASQGRLNQVTDRIAKIKRRLKTDDDIEPLIDVLTDLERDRKQLASEVETIKEKLSTSDDLGPTQDLIRIMDTTEDREVLRQRIKARIRDLISCMLVVVRVDGQTRSALVEITLITGVKRWVAMRVTRGVGGVWHQSASTLDDWKALLGRVFQ
jgi:DNA invertase Pin-like site-specific DNA recombinase